jgi:3-hydroxyisobutyrate dehydrogenase
VVITMLPTADVVDSVIFDGDVVGAFADGCVWAQMGTIGVAATLRMKGRLAATRPGVMFVDAPVSGSKGPAQQGQLLILASGPPRRLTSCGRCLTFSAARPCGLVRPGKAAR